MTSAPDTVPAPQAQPPAAPQRLGNLRSMVISMAVILAAVLAWVAMVPRVREVSQPAVDVSAVARHVRQETSWEISQPQLPVGWKATNVRFAPAGDGLRTWHAGYLSPPGMCPQGEDPQDRCYASIDQTLAATQGWISAQSSRGRGEGTLSAAGSSWQKLSSSEPVQRSLVARGSGPGDLTTVLSGTASYEQLAEFAETLRPVPMPAPEPAPAPAPAS